MSIASGADGALWFTESLTGQIGRITTAGVITEYPIPSGARPQYIAPAADGALWFTETGLGVGRITTAGVITEYPTPTQPNGTLGIIGLRDGSIYFSENANKIGRVVHPTAILSAAPATDSPGATVTLTGSGFAAGESVGIYSNSTSANLLDTVTATPDGAVSATVRVPSLPYGASSFVAVGASSSKLAVAPYSVTPALGLSSKSGLPGTNVKAAGYGFQPGETVNLVWDNPRVALGNPIADPLGSFSGVGAASIQIPASAPPGPHAVLAQSATSGATAKAYIQVE